MSKLTPHLVLASLLFVVASCQKDDSCVSPISCAPEKPVVKSVNDAEGLVRYDDVLKQYIIYYAEPGSYDSVNYGVLCGQLSDNLRVVEKKVVFSGSYKAYGPAPRALPAGYAYYYLDISKIAAQ